MIYTFLVSVDSGLPVEVVRNYVSRAIKRYYAFDSQEAFKEAPQHIIRYVKPYDSKEEAISETIRMIKEVDNIFTVMYKLEPK